MTQERRITTLLALSLSVAAVLAACGKATNAPATAGRPADRPATQPARPPEPASPRTVYESAAMDLQAMFDRLATETPADAPGAAPAAAQPVATIDPVPPAPPPAASGPSARERRVEYTKELAQLLHAEGAGADSPLKAALPLIALETIQPGVARAELDALLARLTPQERLTIDAVRSLMAELDAQADNGADPRALADAVASAVSRGPAAPAVVAPVAEPAAPVADPEPAPTPPPPAPVVGDALALGNVALCRRVDSYGRYTTYSTSSFLARQRIPMIVYTEVENYAQARETELPPADGRPTGLVRPGTPERWALELSQEIHLYAADGSLQWFVKEQTHRDVSQSKRRDFFLVQRIDLPATLSVGRYTLKVIVRDKGAARLAGLSSDAEPATEVNIPIQIVADAAVAARDTTRPVVSGRPISAANPATVTVPTDRPNR